jgi:hypothetical protein
MDYKVGDIIYIKQSGGYSVCKIENIKNNDLWGYWSIDISSLPKTFKEFNNILKRTHQQYINAYDSCLKGKLILNLNKRIS